MDINNSNAEAALVTAIAEGVCRDAKDFVVSEVARKLPHNGPKGTYSTGQAVCIATTIIMMLDSVVEASLRSAERDPANIMATAPLNLFDGVVAKKLARLRELIGE